MYVCHVDNLYALGLEWLIEFQKPDQSVDPWYVCHLCHMKVDWNEVVDHVVTVLHRTKFIVSSLFCQCYTISTMYCIYPKQSETYFLLVPKMILHKF